VLRKRGYDGKRIGIEMRNPETFTIGAFDVGSFLTLQKMLPNAEFVDTTDLIMELRLIKIAQEIAYMREAGKLTMRGLFASLAAVGEGKFDNDIIAAGHHAMIASSSELMSADPMIMSGERTGWMPHVPYKRHAIKRGDSIYLEYTGTYHRYNAPAMRSAAVGNVTKEVQRLTYISLETVKLILEHARPGRTGHDVARDAGKILRKHKDIYFHGALGYSIGMSNQPTWGEAPCTSPRALSANSRRACVSIARSASSCRAPPASAFPRALRSRARAAIFWVLAWSANSRSAKRRSQEFTRRAALRLLGDLI